MRQYAIAIIAFLLFSLPAHSFAENNVRVVDSKSVKKTSKVKTPANTRVINLKGRSQKTSKNSNNICPELNDKFYCRNVGSNAVEAATGEPLGEITGVAWKTVGETMYRYLPVGWLEHLEGEEFNLNTPSTVEGFFYIVKAEGQLTFLVECQRISIAK